MIFRTLVRIRKRSGRVVLPTARRIPLPHVVDQQSRDAGQIDRQVDSGILKYIFRSQHEGRAWV